LVLGAKRVEDDSATIVVEADGDEDEDTEQEYTISTNFFISTTRL